MVLDGGLGRRRRDRSFGRKNVDRARERSRGHGSTSWTSLLHLRRLGGCHFTASSLPGRRRLLLRVGARWLGRGSRGSARPSSAGTGGGDPRSTAASTGFVSSLPGRRRRSLRVGARWHGRSRGSARPSRAGHLVTGGAYRRSTAASAGSRRLSTRHALRCPGALGSRPGRPRARACSMHHPFRIEKGPR